MACSSCAQRRKLIGQIVKQAGQGNVSAVKQSVRQIGQTVRNDLAKLNTVKRNPLLSRPPRFF